MSTTWDILQVSIDNKLSSPITLSVIDSELGEYEFDPDYNPYEIAPDGKGVFKLKSWPDDMRGCVGNVSYSLIDGTVCNLQMKVDYIMGPNDDSYYNCTFGGARANLYTANSEVVTLRNGCAKYVYWTLSLGLAPAN